ncbi:MAG: hypothetical protein K2W96_12125 [Gemmataceae bacterium]|nr:hypothetical protein [Gemmataceae bacterium]
MPHESTILGVEGGLAVVRHGEELAGKREGAIDAFDLETGKQLTSYSTNGDTRLIAVRDGVGYFAVPIPDEIGKIAGRRGIVALDLLKRGEPIKPKGAPPALRTTQSALVANGLALLTDRSAFEKWAKRS